MTPRPQIQRITLEAVLPDGTPRTYTIDLSQRRLSALFWDDFGVNEVLAGHYAGRGKRISRTHLSRRFPHVPCEFEGEDTELTPELVTQIWNAPQADGLAISYLAKDPDCQITNDL